MLIHNGKIYNKIIRGGKTYDRIMRNGKQYGGDDEGLKITPSGDYIYITGADFIEVQVGGGMWKKYSGYPIRRTTLNATAGYIKARDKNAPESVVENDVVTPTYTSVAAPKLILNKDFLFTMGKYDNDPSVMLSPGSTQDVLGWNTKMQPYTKIFYDFQKGFPQRLSQIRYRTGWSSMAFKVYGVLNDTFERIELGYGKTNQNTWSSIAVDDRLSLRAIIIELDGAYMLREIEFYGHDPVAPPVVAPAVAPTQLKDKTGINGHPWTIYNNASGGSIFTNNFNFIKDFATNFRSYSDWKIYQVEDNKYRFQKSFGSWKEDDIRQIMKDAGMLHLTTLHRTPLFIVNTWPQAARSVNEDLIPVKYPAKFDDPNSYKDLGDLAFQHAARYGETIVASNLLNVEEVDGNIKKTALNTVKWIEVGNEYDRWWAGGFGLPLQEGGNRVGYMTFDDYAACISHVYDRIKEADPTMKVAMVGMANTTPDYLKGMLLWFEKNRGYLPNGQVDIPFDAINWHFYGGSTLVQQTGTGGMCPEKSAINFKSMCEAFNKFRRFKPELELWITETGYDDRIGVMNSGAPNWTPYLDQPDPNKKSPYYAAPIGGKSSRQVVADWNLRTLLLSARYKISRIFFYESFDQRDPNLWGTVFGNMGWMERVDGDDNNVVKKPVAHIFTQFKTLFGEYTYQETITDGYGSDAVCVDKYVNGENTAYSLWMPTMNGSTVQYTLSGLTSPSVTKYDFDYNSDTPTAEVVPVVGDQVTLTVTEKPVFIKEN